MSDESGSISSSEPLAHSEGSEQAFGSSSLLLSNQKSRNGDERENAHRRHRRRIHRDDDAECSSSAQFTSSVRQSLKKRKNEWEKASTDDDQVLVNYKELPKEEKNDASPLFPHSARKRSNSLPKNNNKVTNKNPTTAKARNDTNEKKRSLT